MPMKLPIDRRSCFCLVVACLTLLVAVSETGYCQQLVSNQVAARVGLERAWFAQVRVDSTAHQVVHWVLDGDRLFALTSAGTVQSINAHTGETMWTTEVGAGHSGAAGMAVNTEYVAVLGASRLYMLDRLDGHSLWSRQIGGGASAAPALSSTYAYVTLLNGRVEGYDLDEPNANVWQYQSYGHTFQSPRTTGNVVSWPSDRGLLYVGSAEAPRLLFRVETNDEIVAAPAELEPYLYVASLDGYLYCFHEQSGGEQWRYATGFAITSQPAIVGEKAFVASEGPSLHAVNAITGEALWKVGGANQFVALGEQHTYGMDRYGTLIVIDNESGNVAGRLATGTNNTALVNDKSDRLFLISNRGLVQCLHEIGAEQPTWHRTKEPADVSDPETKPDGAEGSGAKPTAEDVEDTQPNPFKTDDSDDGFDEEDGANPFEF